MTAVDCPGSEPPARIDTEWYAQAFTDLYMLCYAHRGVEEAREEADFAVHALELTARDTVLDLCCGMGRHLVHLQRMVAAAVGLDYSADLLARARQTCGHAARLVRGDMRAIPFRGVFDAVLNFFTSFGYFLEEAENEMVAREIARSLKPGGRFFLDYLNAPYTVSRLEPESERRVEGRIIRERRWIDPDRQRLNKRTDILEGGRSVFSTAESVRLYGRDELEDLLGRAGLRVVRWYGDYKGSAHTDASPRMMGVGRLV